MPRKLSWPSWLPFRPEQIKVEWLRIVLVTAGVLLLLLHGLIPETFLVDTTTLGLLAFVLVALLLPHIEEVDLFGQKIKLDRGVRETAGIAATVEAETPSEPEDEREDEPEEVPVGSEREADLVLVDPITAVAEDRARVVEALVDLYSVVFDEQPPSIESVVARLQYRRYLDARLATLANSLLALTAGAARYRELKPEQAASIRSSAVTFLRGLSRVASRAFENEVFEALRPLLDKAEVRRNARATRPQTGMQVVVDFLIVSQHGRIVVEAVFMTKPTPKAVPIRRAADRIHNQLRLFQAQRGIIVIPNGARPEARESRLAPQVRVIRIRELADGVRDDDLLNE
ncbi:MAG: hypothetical protein M3540_04655 [Actinomycetota bacterium]|nr:hypothetical protein [Actinomycetota bacterium]